MNVVILSGCDPTALYMIERLRRERPIKRILRVVWTTEPMAPGRSRSLAERTRSLSVSKIAEHLHTRYSDRQFESIDTAVKRELFPDGSRRVELGDHDEISAREINAPATVERLRELSPDIMIVNGAPILKPSLFEVPRLGTINVHFGISPAYRGSHTLFWPVYNRDYANIGTTLHWMNRDVDAGAVLAQGWPALAPSDTEATIKAHCARLAAKLALEILKAAEHKDLPGVRQEGPAHVYRKRDRKLSIELRYAIRRLVGQATVPNRPERTARYF